MAKHIGLSQKSTQYSTGTVHVLSQQNISIFLPNLKNLVGNGSSSEICIVKSREVGGVTLIFVASKFLGKYNLLIIIKISGKIFVFNNFTLDHVFWLLLLNLKLTRPISIIIFLIIVLQMSPPVISLMSLGRVKGLSTSLIFAKCFTWYLSTVPN